MFEQNSKVVRPGKIKLISTPETEKIAFGVFSQSSGDDSRGRRIKIEPEFIAGQTADALAENC